LPQKASRYVPVEQSARRTRGTGVDDQVVGPDLTLTTDRDGDRAIVAIEGELDAYSAPNLDEEVTRLLEIGVTDFVFDLAATKFIDSSGLRTILNAHRVLGDREGRLALRAPSEPVRRLLDITGLTDHFAIES